MSAFLKLLLKLAFGLLLRASSGDTSRLSTLGVFQFKHLLCSWSYLSSSSTSIGSISCLWDGYLCSTLATISLSFQSLTEHLTVVTAPHMCCNENECKVPSWHHNHGTYCTADAVGRLTHLLNTNPGAFLEHWYADTFGSHATSIEL